MRSLFTDGHCNGPLFAPQVKRRPAARRARGWAWYHKRHTSRTPRWARRWVMDFVYATAVLTGREVDHIVPLNHPLVCGLHVEHNLQLLKPEVNRRKGNNWWPGMWGEQMELEC